MTSGVWRGESSLAKAVRMRLRRSSVSSTPSASLTKRIASESTGPAGLDVHDQAVGDLGEALDDGVEVARAETHPAPVECGVGAPADHARPVVGERHPVAVAPDPGEVLEVGGAVLGTFGITQKPTGIDGIGLVITSSPVTPAGRPGLQG